jgi:hypothetical protein
MGIDVSGERGGHEAQKVQFDPEMLQGLMDAFRKVDGIVHTVENVSVESGIELLRSEGRKGAFTASGARTEEGKVTTYTVSDEHSTPLLEIVARIQEVGDTKQVITSTIKHIGQTEPSETVTSTMTESNVPGTKPTVALFTDVKDAQGRSVRHASGVFNPNDDRTLNLRFSDGAPNNPLPIKMSLTLDGKNVLVTDPTGEIINGTSSGLYSTRYEVR